MPGGQECTDSAGYGEAFAFSLSGRRVAAKVKEMSVMRLRREPPMLRVPAWKSASWPPE
jgi:hypothetical protein